MRAFWSETDEVLIPGETVIFSLLVAISVVSRLTNLSNFSWRVVKIAASANTFAW